MLVVHDDPPALTGGFDALSTAIVLPAQIRVAALGEMAESMWSLSERVVDDLHAEQRWRLIDEALQADAVPALLCMGNEVGDAIIDLLETALQVGSAVVGKLEGPDAIAHWRERWKLQLLEYTNEVFIERGADKCNDGALSSLLALLLIGPAVPSVANSMIGKRQLLSQLVRLMGVTPSRQLGIIPASFVEGLAQTTAQHIFWLLLRAADMMPSEVLRSCDLDITQLVRLLQPSQKPSRALGRGPALCSHESFAYSGGRVAAAAGAKAAAAPSGAASHPSVQVLQLLAELASDATLAAQMCTPELRQYLFEPLKPPLLCGPLATQLAIVQLLRTILCHVPSTSAALCAEEIPSFLLELCRSRTIPAAGPRDGFLRRCASLPMGGVSRREQEPHEEDSQHVQHVEMVEELDWSARALLLELFSHSNHAVSSPSLLGRVRESHQFSPIVTAHLSQPIRRSRFCPLVTCP